MLFRSSIVSDLKSELIDASLFGQYTGSGTYNIYCQVYQWTNYTGTGEIKYSIDMPVNVSGHITITYDYTIPEPATITMLCIGALAFLKRKGSK